MKAPKLLLLKRVYNREEDFSADLSNNLNLLNIGLFEDSEPEAKVGTRRADIVATGTDGTLVIENQFGMADWDHWGRLEAYARIKEATTAALIAEDFDDLMVATCNLRNQDSEINWYLIKAQVNDHNEFIFHFEARPDIDIQTERNIIEYSEFWAPIRKNTLFAGKPVPIRDSWISKGVKGAAIEIHVNKNSSYILIAFNGESRIDKRDRSFDILSSLKYDMNKRESNKFANIHIPIMEKGENDIEYWDQIRDKIVKVGTEVYDLLNK